MCERQGRVTISSRTTRLWIAHSLTRSLALHASRDATHRCCCFSLSDSDTARVLGGFRAAVLRERDTIAYWQRVAAASALALLLLLIWLLLQTRKKKTTTR